MNSFNTLTIKLHGRGYYSCIYKVRLSENLKWLSEDNINIKWEGQPSNLRLILVCAHLIMLLCLSDKM